MMRETTIIAGRNTVVSINPSYEDVGVSLLRQSKPLANTDRILQLVWVYGEKVAVVVQKTDGNYAIKIGGDNGAGAWTEVLSSSSEIRGIALVRPGHVLAYTATGYYESADAGSTFLLVNGTDKTHRSACASPSFVIGHNTTSLDFSDDVARTFSKVLDMSAAVITEPITPAIADSDGVVLAGFGNLAYVSIDPENTWSLAFSCLPGERITEIVSAVNGSFMVKTYISSDPVLLIPVYRTYSYTYPETPVLQYYQESTAVLPAMSSNVYKPTGESEYTYIIPDVSSDNEGRHWINTSRPTGMIRRGVSL